MQGLLDMDEVLYNGRGLPLLANVARFANSSGVPLVGVSKTGSPTDAIYRLRFFDDGGGGIDVTAKSLYPGTNYEKTENVTDGGTSNTLISGLTVTYPGTAVVGDSLITVSKFGDPKLDQAVFERFADGTGATSVDLTITAATYIALGASQIYIEIVGVDHDVASSGLDNWRIIQGSTTLAGGGSSSGSSVTQNPLPAAELGTGLPIALSGGDITVRAIFPAAKTNTVVWARGWYE